MGRAPSFKTRIFHQKFTYVFFPARSLYLQQKLHLFYMKCNFELSTLKLSLAIKTYHQLYVNQTHL